MIIAVDVDGTVADLHTPWIKWYNERWNDTLHIEDVTTWELIDHVHPDCGPDIFKFIEEPDNYGRVSPIEGAVDGVNALREMGHRVIFATSTNKYVAGRKLVWLAENGFLTLKYGTISTDYMEVHDKSLIRADILIDDGVHNLEAFNPILRDCILFDQPWNRACDDHERAYGWGDVIHIVETLQ